MTRQAKHYYEFSSFRLDPAERILMCDTKPVQLTPKAFEILFVLVENSGHIVEKKLLNTVWPDSFVEER